MKGTVILSTNDNPDYLNYLPYVQRAWNKLGWKTLTFRLVEEGNNVTFIAGDNDIVAIYPSPKYRKETVTQVSRLFAHKYDDGGLIMTSDVDMIPMSNYWNPEPNRITCYGYDLTGFKELPICYIAAPAQTWRELIPENSIEELLDKYPNALSDDFYTYWGCDQQIITERILAKGGHRVIMRGVDNRTGLAVGRVDRANWERTLNIPSLKIDAHMRRPFNKEDAEQILSMVTV